MSNKEPQIVDSHREASLTIDFNRLNGPESVLREPLDEDLYKDLISSAGLAVKIRRVLYVPTGPSNGTCEAGEVKQLEGVEPVERYIATCDQFPDMDIANRRLDAVHLLVYNFLVRTKRYRVSVNGTEIFGSAQALRAHGLFLSNEGLTIPEGAYFDQAYVRMEPLKKQGPCPSHRFFARDLKALGGVVNAMESRGVVMEVSFRKGGIDGLLKSNVFKDTPDWGSSAPTWG